MKIIGITGPTGAGKTTALAALEELGGCIIDCDAVYHKLLKQSRPLLAELEQRFGPGVFQNGAIDRKALGRVVFGDQAALNHLNAITHRYVGNAVDEALIAAQSDGRPAAAIDAIALIESGLDRRCHVTVAVTAPEAVRVARIMAREGICEEYARLRIAAQKPESFFREACTHVLVNDCASAEEFYARALTLFRMILTEK